MKERPIIMSADMVKAILDGSKTMSRRVIKLEDYHRNVWDYCIPHNDKSARLLGEPYLKVPYDAITDNAGTRITCPYGQVGDRLWVRETWQVIGDTEEDDYSILYKADNNYPIDRGVKWCSPLFMPRWASRITLEITGVRAERLWDITEEDAIKEGCQLIARTIQPFELKPSPRFTAPERPFTHRDHFIGLWDSLNAKRGYGWKTNPWVWGISFTRIKQ